VSSASAGAGLSGLEPIGRGGEGLRVGRNRVPRRGARVQERERSEEGRNGNSWGGGPPPRSRRRARRRAMTYKKPLSIIC